MKLTMLLIESQQVCIEGYSIDALQRIQQEAYATDSQAHISVQMVDLNSETHTRRRAMVDVGRIAAMYEIDENETWR